MLHVSASIHLSCQRQTLIIGPVYQKDERANGWIQHFYEAVSQFPLSDGVQILSPFFTRKTIGKSQILKYFNSRRALYLYGTASKQLDLLSKVAFRKLPRNRTKCAVSNTLENLKKQRCLPQRDSELYLYL